MNFLHKNDENDENDENYDIDLFKMESSNNLHYLFLNLKLV